MENLKEKSFSFYRVESTKLADSHGVYGPTVEKHCCGLYLQ